MKIVFFQGGLGNQLFEYTYYKYLTKKFPKAKIFGYYPSKWLKDHNGLEIQKWFEVVLPKTTLSSRVIAFVVRHLNMLSRHLHLPHILSNPNWECDDNALFQEGFWQDKVFFEKVGPPVLREFFLDDYNNAILKDIKESDSVCVHVRGGDYLTPSNQEVFGNICTEDYYNQAIDIIHKAVKNPVFFIFTNDFKQAKRMFASDDNIRIVDGNSAERSFYDMFLMSKCKHMVLANSSFSCWAAYLNEQVKTVVAPSRWSNLPPFPRVNLDRWIIIDIDE